MAGCLGPSDGPVPCRHCSVTLPVSAGGSVRQTLNIQRADCGRGEAALWQARGPHRGTGAGAVWGRLGVGTRGGMPLGVSLLDTLEGSVPSRKGCLCDGASNCSEAQGKQPVLKRTGQWAMEGLGETGSREVS